METPADDRSVQPASARLGDEVKRFRLAAKLTQQALADRVYYSRSYIALIETGREHPSAEAVERLASALHDDGVLQRLHRLEVQAPSGIEPKDGDDAPLVTQQLESLRRDLTDSLNSGLTHAALDHWQRIILNHGRATRYRSAALILPDLATDFAELQRLLTGCRTASSMRTLTAATAQMAGLISLTLLKVGNSAGARNWARTAWLAANEAGDSTLKYGCERRRLTRTSTVAT